MANYDVLCEVVHPFRGTSRVRYQVSAATGDAAAAAAADIAEAQFPDDKRAVVNVEAVTISRSYDLDGEVAGSFATPQIEPLGAVLLTDFSGIDPTGASDSSAALAAAFARGGEIVVPDGDYLLAYAGADTGGASIYLTTDLRVVCRPGARFIIECDNDAFRFNVPSGGAGLPADGITIEWVGGYFDQSGQPTSTSVPFLATYPAVVAGASATCDALSFRGGYTSGTVRSGFRRVVVQGARFYAGAHWQTAGGDTAIYFEGCDFALICGSDFQALRDQGVYASRDGTGVAGGTVRVEGNRFVNCCFGDAYKRGLDGWRSAGNHYVNCIVGTQANTVTGKADDGVVTGNTYEGCSYNVRLQESTGVIVRGNRTISVGATLADGTTRYSPYAGSKPAMVLMQGTTFCTVADEMCDTLTAAYIGQNAAGVWMEDSSGIGCTYNLIRDVFTTDFTRCVEEESGSLANFNRVEGCYNWGSAGSRDPVLIGAATVAERLNTTTMKRVFTNGFHVGDGSQSAPLISRVTQTGTGIFFGTNKVAIATNAGERFGVTTTAATATVPVIPAILTTTQRDALTASEGMLIFNTTTKKHQGHNGTTWTDLY